MHVRCKPQSGVVDWLEEIVERFRIERVQGVLLMRSKEHYAPGLLSG